MTPLVEVANKQGDPTGLSPRSPLARVAEDMHLVLGSSDFFFLDFHDGLPIKTLLSIVSQAIGHGLPFVPVVSPERVQQAKALRTVLDLSTGMCIRLPITGRVRRTGQSMSQQIDDLIDFARTTPDRCDVVLDLGYIPPSPGYTAADVHRAIEELEDVEALRNLVLVGTSIPETLAAINHDSVGELERHELVFWDQLRQMRLRRMPSFGDYIVQAPKRPRGMGRPVANLRYTSGKRVILARGHRMTRGDHEQYRDLCEQLASRPEFRGADFSWGDSEIAKYATRDDAPLGQQHWRAVGSSHHFAETIEAVG